MPRSRDAILAELVTVLKTITGTAYYSDLGSRVFRRFRNPMEASSDGPLPAVYVVEAGTTQTIRNDDRSVRVEIQAEIIGYVAEDSTDPRVSNAATAASKLHDDIMRALLSNLRLNGQCPAGLLFRDCVVDGGLDDVYGGVRIGITLPYHFTAADLGPLAP